MTSNLKKRKSEFNSTGSSAPQQYPFRHAPQILKFLPLTNFKENYFNFLVSCM